MTSKAAVQVEAGKMVRKMRTDRGLGLRQATTLAQLRGYEAMTVNAVGALERGETQNPNPHLLRQIADFYREPYENVAAPFLSNRYGVVPDLPRHAEAAQSRAAHFQPQRGGQRGHPSSIGAVTSRVQSVDPVLIKILERASYQVGKALARARGQSVSKKDAGA